MGRTFGWAAVLLLLGLAGCGASPGGPTSKGTGASSVPAPPRIEPGAPDLSVGDNWLVNATLRGNNVTIRYDSTMTVVALEPHELAGRTYNATRIDTHYSLDVQGADGVAHLQTAASTWTRTSDGAQLEVRSKTDIDRHGQLSTTYSNLTYDEPCPLLDWPLEAGKNWTTRCVVHDGTNAVHVTTEYKVEDREQVTVPAGTFAAYKVSADTTAPNTGPTHSDLWWAPAACAFVKQVADSGQVVTTLILKARTCAKA